MRFATEHRRDARLHYVFHSCGHTLTYDDSKRGILDDLRLHRMSLRPCTYCERGWGMEAVSLEDDCGAKPFAERIRGRLLPAVDDLIDRMADKLAEDWPIDVTWLAQRACLGRIHRDVLFQSSAMWWLERRHYNAHRLVQEKLDEMRDEYA